MFAFNTSNKKPKVWNIALATLVLVAGVLLMHLCGLTNPFFISAIFCLYLILVIALLVRAFLGQLKYNPYSYNTIYYSSFSIFLLFELISQIAITRYFYISADLQQDVLQMNILSTILGSAKTYMLFTAPFILVFSVALCISNISLIKHEGKRFVNILGIILSVMLVGGEVFLFIRDYAVSGSLLYVIIYDLFTNLFAALYLYFECMLIGTIISNIVVLKYKPLPQQDYIIILGCGLMGDGTPTPLLKGRIDRAIEFGNNQIKETGKVPIYIASGGQGPDEYTSEGESIKEYLVSKRIPEDRILTETKSTSTYENMLYSKKIIENSPKYTPESKILYSTTNYHVFRSGLMARRVGMKATGIGAKTKWYFWPNATVREFVGILTEHKLKQGLILGGMALFYGIVTIIYYNI